MRINPCSSLTRRWTSGVFHRAGHHGESILGAPVDDPSLPVRRSCIPWRNERRCATSAATAAGPRRQDAVALNLTAQGQTRTLGTTDPRAQRRGLCARAVVKACPRPSHESKPVLPQPILHKPWPQGTPAWDTRRGKQAARNEITGSRIVRLNDEARHRALERGQLDTETRSREATPQRRPFNPSRNETRGSLCAPPERAGS